MDKKQSLEYELNFMQNGIKNLRYQIINSEKLNISKEEMVLIKAQLSSIETGCSIIKARLLLIK